MVFNGKDSSLGSSCIVEEKEVSEDLLLSQRIRLIRGSRAAL
jgi:hypothetical protein